MILSDSRLVRGFALLEGFVGRTVLTRPDGWSDPFLVLDAQSYEGVIVIPPRINSELLLVGSLPADSTDEALRAGGEIFGDLVFALPDGETGPRALWMAYEYATLLEPNPAIEITNKLDHAPRHAEERPILAIREGTDTVHFESWPRIDDAIESYAAFKSLRDEGVIPSSVRFQVCLPFPTNVFSRFTKNFSHDYALAAQGFEELFEREIKRLTDAIPTGDLAIQLDVCWEVLDIEGVIDWTDGDAWDRFAGPVTRLAPMIPEDVLVGYHFCYGTSPSWPMFEAFDMTLPVKMSNYAAENSGRIVDWLHLSGPKDLRSQDRRFYEPLADLKAPDARVFLGIGLPVDGIEGLRRRHACASEFLDDFGVANYCGFGRQPGQDGMETMREHADIVKALASA